MRLSLDDAHRLAVSVLLASNTSKSNAGLVAKALVAAEADNLPSHGLSRLPFYADQAICGKVDGQASPQIRQPKSGQVHVDARYGFAFPAIDMGILKGIEVLQQTGTVSISIGRSHHAGVGGYHVEQAALHGALALGFTNSPSAIAPWGGYKGTFGTNPIAFASPRKDEPPLVIDLSLSVVARGKIMQASKKGESVPKGWARNEAGEITTDASEALAGTMETIGGAKGAALALMVEILAATLTGSNHAYEASSFFDNEGGPPSIGQFFLLIDPGGFSENFSGDAGFETRLEQLLKEISLQPNARLPGERRLTNRRNAEENGIEVDDTLFDDLQSRVKV